MSFLVIFFDILVELAPWLFLGSFIAGILHIFVPRDFLYHHFGSPKLKHIIAVSLLGVPIPLCSCAVLPTALGMNKNGVSKSACMSFLISTPQTGVDSIFVTATFLSLPFAIFKLISALILGVIAGVAFSFFEKEDFVKQEEVKIVETEPIKKSFMGVVDYAINDIIKGLWKWLLIGIILSALITTFIPLNFFENDWQVGVFTAMLVVLVGSIPLYVCAISSVPIAVALISCGFPPSAALVFLIAGPATNLVTIGLIMKSFGKLFLTIYLLVVIIGSLVFGYLFDFLLSDVVMSSNMEEHNHLWGYLFAILLILLMFYFAYDELSKKKKDCCQPEV